MIGTRASWSVLVGTIAAASLLYVVMVPVLGQDYNLRTLTIIPAYGLAVVGLALVFGITHQLLLGHAAFFAGGAYLYGILAGAERSWDPFLAAVVAVVVVGVAAYLLGLVLLRLAGFYFAVATLGLGLIVENVIFALRDYTGGDNGLVAPTLALGDLSPETPRGGFFLAWTILAFALALAWNLRSSATGRAARAIGLDERLATAQGVNVPRVKRRIFVFAAMLGAVGGVVYASTVHFITPQLSSLSLTLEWIVAVVLGGMGSLILPVVAVGVFEWLPIAFEQIESDVGLVFGILLVLFMVLGSDDARGGKRVGRVASNLRSRFLPTRAVRGGLETRETP